jgi:hypothetical protein
LAAFKDSYEPRGQTASIVLKPAVEGGLPAASLIEGKIHFHPEPAQHADHARSDLRGELIYQAGDEKRDPHCLSKRSGNGNKVTIHEAGRVGQQGKSREKKFRGDQRPPLTGIRKKMQRRPGSLRSSLQLGMEDLVEAITNESDSHHRMPI